MTTTSIDEQYWLAYTKAITAKVLGSGLKNTDGKKSYFFVASDANRSVPASMFIPKATTNNWLYPAADALLDPKTVIYAPSDDTSYFEAVRQYMLNVDLSDPNDTSEGAAERKQLLNAQLETLTDQLAEAERKKRKYEKDAKKDYKEYLDEEPEGQAFESWVSDNAKVYLASLDKVRTVSGQVRAKQLEESGPMSGVWAAQTDRLNNLTNPLSQLPGISMACYDQQTTNVEEQLEKVKRTRPETVVAVPEPSPSTCFYKPLYTISDGYREAMDRWNRDFDLGPASGGGSTSFTIDEEKQNSWKEFGFEKTEGSGGISYFGLFRVGASGSKTEYKETVSAEKSSSKITFEISWNNMEFFNVQAGNWNVPNLKQSYPRTRPSYKENTKPFVRPTQFLCASGLSIKTVVSSSMRKELNEKIEKAKSISGNGGVRIGLFGLDASIGHESKEGKESSTVNWNAETGELVFKPTKTFGSSVLVGVMCQEVNV